MNQLPTATSRTSGRVKYWHRLRYVAMAALILPGLVRSYPLSLYLIVSMIGTVALVAASAWLAGGFHPADKRPVDVLPAGKSS